eukprot:g7725.t1
MNGITPFHSTLGGTLLGAAASAKLALTGRVLGISGIAKGLIRGDFEPWRLAFLSGLTTGALIACELHSSTSLHLPYSFTRVATSGFLVGFGTSVGNGCTSGHGICGNARLSIRSLVYTCVFMVSGMVTATLMETADVLGATKWPELVLPSRSFMWSASLLTLITLVSLVLPLIISLITKKSEEVSGAKSNGFLDCLSEFVSGGVFATGLYLSGMTQPSKVAAFLSPLSPAFDPSLLCVMGGALLITTPSFYWILKKGDLKNKRPFFGDGFQVPVNKMVDWKLVIGGVVFGAGWGLGGICPGPALVSIVKPTLKLTTYCISMFIGFAIDLIFGKYIFPTKIKP